MADEFPILNDKEPLEMDIVMRNMCSLEKFLSQGHENPAEAIITCIGWLEMVIEDHDLDLMLSDDTAAMTYVQKFAHRLQINGLGASIIRPRTNQAPEGVH